MYFNEDALKQLAEGYGTVPGKSEELLCRFASRRYLNEQSKEFAMQGFVRRIQILELCIENIFGSIPPEQTESPDRKVRRNVEINIQAFVISAFGCLDNLAWILVIEKKFKGEKGKDLRNSQIGLRKENELIRSQVSKPFINYLITLDKWMAQLEDFRHALAHRIPLYIPPFTVLMKNVANYHDLESRRQSASTAHDHVEYDRLTAEQNKLKSFRPWMQHSFFEESAPIVFHPQVLADFNTVFEVAGELLKELDRK